MLYRVHFALAGFELTALVVMGNDCTSSCKPITVRSRPRRLLEKEKGIPLRDRPFKLKGGGGVWFLIRSEKKFRTTQELEYLFFCREIFFHKSTLGYMTKTLNQIIFFFLHQNQNIFFSTIGNRNIFVEKNHNPPPSS